MKTSHKAILDAVIESPGISYREIGDKTGLAYSTVAYHVPTLLKMGLVSAGFYKNRTLRAFGRIVKNKRVTGYICKRNDELYWTEG